MTTLTYATATDVQARWPEKVLSTAELATADTLCADASRRARARWRTLDARVAAGTLDPDDVRMVIATMVKRAMLASGAEGMTNDSRTAGPFSQTRTYANPMGNLYFSKEDVMTLDPPEAERLRSIRVKTVW